MSAGRGGATGDHPTFLAPPATLIADLLRYATAMGLVAVVAAAVFIGLDRNHDSEEASEVESAVMVDLAPSEPSATPVGDAAEQQSAMAASATARVEPLTRPAEKEPELPPPDAVALPQPMPIAPAVTPPPAPTTTARDEQSPTGSAVPDATAETGDAGAPRASKHAITLWQRSLLLRLERSKRHADARAHPAGTVAVAFIIGVSGELASLRVAHSSGSATLDLAALAIVRQAAPFAPPPSGSAPLDSSFVLPVRFR